MKVVPLGDKVVVRRLEAEEQTAGGIVLPDTAKEVSRQGKVLSVGDGRIMKDGRRTPLQVSEGDRVIFSSYAGDEIKVEGESLLIMREDDLLAVVE
jgi:chaperonin GroES